MRYIEPHVHMVSRTTDDYLTLVHAGCRAVSEPAFWAGFDRCSADGFRDYFHQLTDFEPKRAAKFHLPHYCWLCINPKEAEDLALARDVVAMIPDFLDRPTVLGIGEIGLNKNTRNELEVLEMHIELAVRHQQLILVHTPHLEDKLKGTRIIVDALRNHAGVQPERVIIDHVEEHTVRLALDAGFWAGLTLYPDSKCTPQRAVDIIETHGHERLWINSACDWGVSRPLAVKETVLEMRRRGFSDARIDDIVYGNPYSFMAQSPHFTLEPDLR